MQITKEILLQGRNIENLKKMIKVAIDEDLHSGDETSKAVFQYDFSLKEAKTYFLAKDTGIISGLVIIPLIIEIAKNEKYIKNDLSFNALVEDGDFVEKGKIISEMSGDFVDILSMERTFLNFLSRMSGVATFTNKLVNILKNANAKAKIYDTRKTIPCFRLLDKYSVNIGGGTNHRLDLNEYLMIKDNYFERDLNSVLKYLASLKNLNDRKLVEIEIDDFKYFEYEEIWNADIIMLDNMNLDNLKKAIKLIRDKEKENNKKYEIEISGGLSMDRLEELKDLDVDRISFGKITHSVPAFDISLDVK